MWEHPRTEDVADFLMPILSRNSVCRTVPRALAATVFCLLIGCTGGNYGNANITVFAAASLTDAFQEIADAFEEENPGVEVKLNFSGSQRLRSQLELGATADIFASADEQQMQIAQEADLIEENFQYFANATMSVIVSERSGISSLRDLGTRGIKVVLAHGGVPAGMYSRQLLQRLSTHETGLGEDYADRVLANLVSEETSVKFVEQKVVIGQADAGIVYRPGALTAQSSGSVRELPLPPEAEAVRALYPIAILRDSDSPDLAVNFINFVLSETGQGILASYGFDAP